MKERSERKRQDEENCQRSIKLNDVLMPASQRANCEL